LAPTFAEVSREGLTHWPLFLTDDSASRYDTQVEILFHGTANATRRQALPQPRSAAPISWLTLYAQCRSNKGAPGLDGQDFADIDA